MDLHRGTLFPGKAAFLINTGLQTGGRGDRLSLSKPLQWFRNDAFFEEKRELRLAPPLAEARG